MALFNLDVKLVPLLLAAVLLYIPIRIYLAFRKNLLAAQASGIPYRCLPIFPHGLLWQLFSPVVRSLLGRLPLRLQPSWLPYIDPEYCWRTSRRPFEELGSDTILFVSPDELYLVVAEPSVVTQITTRRNDFPKPIELYKGIDIYGKNLVTCEGSTWRRHRKTTTPPFGEKNNRLVWQETLFQAKQMVRHWDEVCQSKEANQKPKHNRWGNLINEASHDCMRLSLYVISRAGFDVRCEWPGTEKTGEGEGTMSATEIPEGRKMSYMQSLESLLQNMLPLFIFPAKFLEFAPFEKLRLAGESYYEWGQYMNDVYGRRKQDIIDHKGGDYESMDLMGAMIRGSGQIQGTPNYGKTDVGMSKEEIIGNSFILFLAGHETAANSIHFSLLLLAGRPSFQRRLQAELDSILGDRPPTSWSYDTDLPKLFSGLVGAVMNEELRLIPPVTFIPKSTAPNSPQPLIVGGKQVTIPGGTTIGLHTVATHRDPKSWPFKSSLLSDTDDEKKDLDTFDPERWFANQPGPHAAFDQLRRSPSPSHSPSPPPSAVGEFKDHPISSPIVDSAEDTSPDTALSMFRPSKGAYIPFSEGARACLGRRFAQVEILAALAVILKSHSIELSVDEWATDKEIDSMTDTDKKMVWEKAKKELERKIREEAGSIVTLQLRGEGVKLRFVERGSERFKFEDDEEGDIFVGGAY